MEQEQLNAWAEAVAATLRAERGRAGLHQIDIERRTGISRTSYRLYESAERQPNTTQLAVLAELFQVSPAELIARIEAEYRRRLGGPR